MKRELAIRKLQRIIDKLYENDGVIETPGCSHPAMKIVNAWLFGSLLKGSENPGDVDILLEAKVIGEYRPWHVLGEYDREYYRRHGVKISRPTEYVYKKYLRQRIPLVSLHDLFNDDKVAHPRALIYPTLEFDMR